MKLKTLIISGSAIALAGGLFMGVSYAAQNDVSASASSDPVTTSSPSPMPTLLTHPTPTPTPTPTETATPTPEPTEPAPVAPAPKQTEAAPDPMPTSNLQPPIPVVINCPDYIAATPQPEDRHGAPAGWVAGYTNLPADQTVNPPSIWYDPANTCNAFGF